MFQSVANDEISTLRSVNEKLKTKLSTLKQRAKSSKKEASLLQSKLSDALSREQQLIADKWSSNLTNNAFKEKVETLERANSAIQFELETKTKSLEDDHSLMKMKHDEAIFREMLLIEESANNNEKVIKQIILIFLRKFLVL